MVYQTNKHPVQLVSEIVFPKKKLEHSSKNAYDEISLQ